MKRTKEEIIVHVLESCLTGSSKTAIFYRSNLNFMTVNSYLNPLIKAGFIALIEGPPRKYKITDKGKEILKNLKEAHELL